MCRGWCPSVSSPEAGVQLCSEGAVDPFSHFLVEVLCEIRDWKQSCQRACFRAVRVRTLHLGLTFAPGVRQGHPPFLFSSHSVEEPNQRKIHVLLAPFWRLPAQVTLRPAAERSTAWPASRMWRLGQPGPCLFPKALFPLFKRVA